MKKWFDTLKLFIIQMKCPHTNWDMDTQIRTIKCRGCGKKAWVKEYKNLYPYK